MKKTRETNYDLLKIIACIGIIFIHMTAPILTSQKIETTNVRWQLGLFMNTMSRWCVPIFVMISGAFLLSKEKEITIKEVLKKYFLKTLVIYLLFGLFFQISDNFIFGSEKISFTSISNVFLNSITGNVKYHLWYLSMLLTIYLLYPILKIIADKASEKQMKYLMIVSFISSAVIFSINSFLVLKGTKYTLNIPYRISIYFFYFMLGYYLYKYQNNKKVNIFFIVLGLISFVLTFCLSSYYSNLNSTFISSFTHNSSMFIALISIGIFCFFKEYISKIKFKEKTRKIISEISNTTLTVYLLHPFFIDIISRLGYINPKSLKFIGMIPLYVIIIFVICIIIGMSTKKNWKNNKK